MPKQSSSMSTKISSWIGKYNVDKEVFSTDDNIIFCNACQKSVGNNKKYFIEAHVKTEMHKRALNKKNNLKQALITKPIKTVSEQKSEFLQDLCQTFIKANVPLSKLNAEPFKDFFGKYLKKNIPDESTLRKNYLPVLFENKMSEIRTNIGKNLLYIVVDETTDPRGFCVANLLVGVLCAEETKPPYLIACQRLTSTNYETVCQFVNKNLSKLSENINDRVLMMLTDAATYMVKAAATLKVFYPNIIHVTCLAHGLNRVAEKVRELFPDVNKLINNGKKAFLKAPSRVLKYKELMPNTRLPPEPVITRWGTWLEAALFYAEHFTKFVEVVNALEGNAESVRKLKELVKQQNLKNDLTFLKSHLSFLPTSITKLEKRGLSLCESISLIENVGTNIDAIPREKGKILKDKWVEVLKKNNGYNLLKVYAEILNGNYNMLNNAEINTNPDRVSLYKYAPITSVDVERSFSLYKRILDPFRYSFSEINLEMYIIVNYNK